MNFLIILALSAILVSTGLSFETSRKLQDAEQIKMAESESNVVGAFVVAAKHRVGTTPYNSSNATFDWAAIKATPGLPVGIAGANVPSTWRLKRTSATEWVGCVTVMNELAAQNLIGKSASLPSGANVLVNLSGTSWKFVLGVHDESKKAAVIGLCA